MDTILVLYSFLIGGDCESFERTYREYLPQQQAFSGHLGEMLVRAADDSSSYTIVSRWQTPSFYRWLQSAEHDAIVAMLNAFKRERSEVKKYVVVCNEGMQVL